MGLKESSTDEEDKMKWTTDMKSSDMKARMRRWIVMACASSFAMLGMWMGAEDVSAQDDPLAAGAGQKPYIMILMDTSASMEWTDRGDEEYPRAVATGIDCPSTSCPSGFSCEDGVCLSDSQWDASATMVPEGNNYGDVNDQPVRYGSCYMWEPACGDYERPAWHPTDQWTNEYSNSDMADRLDDMRANSNTRMRNQAQPRHVTLKEVLTGDMLLRPPSAQSATIASLDADQHAPGCWMVPRQRGASTAQTEICWGENKFEELPDHTEPRPHFQEVFEDQKQNGLMDLVATNAIFSLAMFDGYKEKQNWDDDIDDEFNSDFNGVHEDEGRNDKNYNLGVYKIVTPSRLDISTSLVGQLSSFMQTALVDSGYLRKGGGTEFDLEPSDKTEKDIPWLGLSFSNDLKQYLDKYKLGKQPMAKATPLAAAMHDIHHFFATQYGPDENDEVYDQYLNCRPKQVIMMTDGFPEPESRQGGVQLEENSALSAFGFDPDLYPYTWTERAISNFVLDENAGSPLNSGYLIDDTANAPYADLAHRYDPRVHVVALNIDNSNTKVVEKLAKMAIAGKTCAGQMLGSDFIPDANGNCASGNCLDPVQASIPGATCDDCFVPPGGDKNAAAVDCDYPALILQRNDRASLTTALSQLFNFILDAAGTAARTTPAFVNVLDDRHADYAAGGQFQFFAGVKIEGANPFWKGLMYREGDYCKSSISTTETAIHSEINALGSSSPYDPDDASTAVAGDTRRIFTSFAEKSLFDYGTNIPDLVNNTTRFQYWRKLDTSAADEFGDNSYLEGATTNTLIGGRVPFEQATLEDAYADIASELDTLLAQESVTTNWYFGVDSDEELYNLIHSIRGRTVKQDDRLLGGILNGSPVATEPPSLDIPVDSYRSYRERFGERLSMVFVPTVDGMLHAIYSGDVKAGDNPGDGLKVQVRDTVPDPESDTWSRGSAAGEMSGQREAWAYIPQMLHRRYSEFADESGFLTAQPYLMDGNPVVKDVRLCNRSDSQNQNKQACISVAAGNENIVPDQEQWRTVLVQGLGLAGSGYFALDVTRPGGTHGTAAAVEMPDPIPLWEFDPTWEKGQIAGANATTRKSLYYPGSDLQDGKDENGNNFINWNGDACDKTPSSDTNGNGETGVDDYFWAQPFMGQSVGDAAIGTVIVSNSLAGTGANVRRPIAVFSGGAAGQYGTPCSRSERSGRAVYVVDMQTGTMLRRFVSYKTEPGGDTEKRITAPITGSPSLFNAFPGSLVTRGFVGDSEGRLYRIDMTGSDPADWELALFFDPATDFTGSNAPTGPFGPAAFKPALALGSDATERDLLIFYGLGEPGDTAPGADLQMMIALREKFDAQNTVTNLANNAITPSAQELWHLEFGGTSSNNTEIREKLTGKPIVFNNAVYFTTYAVEGADACIPGKSRIWGLEFEGEIDAAGNPTGVIEGVWDTQTDAELSGASGISFGPGTPSQWFAPDSSVLIRGLAVTLGPACGNTVGGTSGSNNSNTQDTRQPTLVAQTGSSSGAGGIQDSSGSSGSGESLSRIEKTLRPPQSENIPLSWKVIRN